MTRSIPAVLALTLGLLLSAQSTLAQPRFGITGGPVLSRLTLDLQSGAEPDVDMVIGLHVGIAVGVDMGPFTLRSGVNYVNAGGLFNGQEFLAREEFDVSYLSVPVDLRLHFRRHGVLRPYIFGGPEFHYQLSLEDDKFYFKDDVDFLNATAAAGFGITIRLPRVPLRFSPEIRYVFNMGDIYNGELVTDDGDIIDTADKIGSQALRLGVLLGF